MIDAQTKQEVTAALDCAILHVQKIMKLAIGGEDIQSLANDLGRLARVLDNVPVHSEPVFPFVQALHNDCENCGGVNGFHEIYCVTVMPDART